MLIFIDDIHKYFILSTEVDRVEFASLEEFESEFGPLDKFSPRPMKSVTSLIEKHTGNFDSEKILDKMLNGKEFYQGKNIEYQGMTRKEISDSWFMKNRKSTRYGTFIHLLAENIANGKKVSEKRPETLQVTKFFDESGYKVIAPEIKIFSEKYGVAGTADLLLEKDGNLYIGDWKTNHGKNIADNVGDHFTKHMSGPCAHLKDLLYYHYALQFSIYRFMLEDDEEFMKRMHPMKFDGQFAIHLKREGKNYGVIRLPYLKEVARKILEENSSFSD